MPNISIDTVDLINNKLRQAMAITRLIQGDSTSEAPLNQNYIDYALSAVYDLIDLSNEVLSDDADASRGKNHG
ncbi:hypothetical protein RHO13_04780 [Orbus wheelerorum]|uniref:hypothetical protein n=1 Tax=Orbus wheelerorum TaxID=3074111 RepID=UPI00370D1B36